MENYFTLGPTPRDESCACVGEEDYEPRARKECRRFIALLRKKFGLEPEGARFGVKDFPHPREKARTLRAPLPIGVPARWRRRSPRRSISRPLI